MSLNYTITVIPGQAGSWARLNSSKMHWYDVFLIHYLMAENNLEFQV